MEMSPVPVGSVLTLGSQCQHCIKLQDTQLVSA